MSAFYDAIGRFAACMGIIGISVIAFTALFSALDGAGVLAAIGQGGDIDFHVGFGTGVVAGRVIVRSRP